ncbi:MAG: 30S ribosome-binding factor RbfA [Chloroflexi bacterium]|nr:30S ribosome-binding factor RbfA [Chloroflexota bacterium]
MSRRLQRLNVLLRRELADLIRSELRDPRLADIVSVTRADVSPDLQNASVYVSVLGDEQAKSATMKALAAAAPFLRRHLTERITIRRTPVLHFFLDETIEEAARVLELMKRMPEPKDQP